MLSPSTLLERRSQDELRRSHTDPYVWCTTAHWACDLVHGRAQAMLGRSTRRHPRSAMTPHWLSCSRKKARLDPRKNGAAGTEIGVGSYAARRPGNSSNCLRKPSKSLAVVHVWCDAWRRGFPRRFLNQQCKFFGDRDLPFLCNSSPSGASSLLVDGAVYYAPALPVLYRAQPRKPTAPLCAAHANQRGFAPTVRRSAAGAVCSG